MNPFARYTLMRILLFGVVLGILVSCGLRGFVLLAAALLVSAPLSYLLLAGPRRAVVDHLAARAAAKVPDRDSQVEDAAIEAAERRVAPALDRAQPRRVGRGPTS